MEKDKEQMESQRKNIIKQYSNWCKGNMPNNLSGGANSIDFAIYCLNQQTTSQQQTIERLRECVQKFIDNGFKIPSDKDMKEAEQLLNTTEPIDQ